MNNDYIYRNAWLSRLAQLPDQWRTLWIQVAATDDPLELLPILRSVIEQRNAGHVDLRLAGQCLAPLLTHPASRNWPDAEFVAIGLDADNIHGDKMTQADDAELWNNIEACYRRILSRLAVDGADSGPR